MKLKLVKVGKATFTFSLCKMKLYAGNEKIYSPMPDKM